MTSATEPPRADAWLAAARPGMQVLDVGARAGAATVLLAERVGPHGRVVAFESDAGLRRELNRRLVHHGLQQRVTVAPFGLSNRETPALRRLDAVFAELRLPRVDLLHIDVGGDEWRVLAGADTTLRRDRPLLSLAFACEHAEPQLAALHDLDYEACGAGDGLPLSCNGEVGVHALARPVEQLAGLPVRLHGNLDALRSALGLRFRGHILEDDIDVAENDCELHGRKRRDAEVLCTVARNRPGPCLDLGTSFGRSAFKLATNVGPEHRVFTVNMLPEQSARAGDQITHVLAREQIGSYCRERGLPNVVQVFADTRSWQPGAEIADLALAFVDACHDQDAVVADSHLCWQRLRPGGALLWHDFSPIERHRRPWIQSVMAGVAQFLADIGHRGPVHHLRGSWIGLIEKAPA